MKINFSRSERKGSAHAFKVIALFLVLLMLCAGVGVFISAQPQVATAAKPTPPPIIVGKWHITSSIPSSPADDIYTIYPDGHATDWHTVSGVKVSDPGTWVQVGGTTNQFIWTWTFSYGTYIDHVTVRSDGSNIDYYNQYNYQMTGIRVPNVPPVPVIHYTSDLADEHTGEPGNLVGATYTCDASQSYDPDGDGIWYAYWTVTSPSGKEVVSRQGSWPPTWETPAPDKDIRILTFTVEEVGAYTVTLKLVDESVHLAPDNAKPFPPDFSVGTQKDTLAIRPNVDITVEAVQGTYGPDLIWTVTSKVPKDVKVTAYARFEGTDANGNAVNWGTARVIINVPSNKQYEPVQVVQSQFSKWSQKCGKVELLSWNADIYVAYDHNSYWYWGDKGLKQVDPGDGLVVVCR